MVGDFNADSDPDLAVANYFGNVSVLLGGPGATFGTVTDFAGGNALNALASGDFNGDSDPDLAVANLQNGVSVLLGGPGGTFGAPTTIAAGNYAQQVVVGDFNNDSDPDLAVTSGGEGVGRVQVLLGGPGGSFGAPSAFATRGATVSVAVGDFDADSRQDLAVANYTSSYPAPTPESGGVAVLLSTLDLTPPETTIDTGPDGRTGDSTPTFTFSSSEPGSTFDCRVDPVRVEPGRCDLGVPGRRRGVRVVRDAVHDRGAL